MAQELGRPRMGFMAGLAVVMLATVAAGCGGPARPVRSPDAASPSGPVAPRRPTIASAGFALPRPVQREVATFAQGVIYLAGGLDAAGASVSEVFSLDLSTGALVSLGSVPQAFHDAAGAMIGDRLFVFGGGSLESSDAVQAFDLSTAKGSVVAHLPRALSDLASGTINGVVFLVGGYDGTRPESTIYATADGTHFRTAGSLPVGLRYAAVAATGAELIIAGGVSASGPVDTVYAFDPRRDKTSLIGHLPSPIGHAAAFVLAGTVYVAGGLDASGAAIRSVFSLDPVSGTVRRLAPLRRPVSDPGVASDGDRAWLIGGWRDGAVAQILVATLGGA